MYLIYRLITACAMLLLAPYYALRGWRHGESWTKIRERLGLLPPEIASRAADAARQVGGQNVWIHAVSVGEVLAAKPLAEAWKQRFPADALFISTTTETGQRLARERLRCVEGVFYFPLDGTLAVRRALRAMRPNAVIVMETEIWPNFLREARRRGVPVIFANARISERSFARFKRWNFLIDQLFANALSSAELFLAQTPEDSARLMEMGAPQDRIEVTGNLKYDAEPPAASPLGDWLREQTRVQERWPVFVAGSVVAEEEESVLAAFDVAQRRWRRALLVLAPRKPERFGAAAEIAQAGGWEAVRRSRLSMAGPLDENADVLLLDSIGELAGIYALADAVFVGGSLVPVGGHNILEPAWFGRPPIFGPHMDNFREMAGQFLAARAAVQVTTGAQLGRVWVQIVEDEPLRTRMGAAAQALWQRHRGATRRSIERIAAVLRGEGMPA
ncbi:MAG TPA: 3-deoxy-D-manno-octulosonic acid transferase [Candidatus Acidoferrales bacterium]|nr:3-deoxy-D-manno-octulosonic acid transferase [Candidatus Acidoferrales bacterium]